MNIDEMSLDEEISASLQIIVQELKEKDIQIMKSRKPLIKLNLIR